MKVTLDADEIGMVLANHAAKAQGWRGQMNITMIWQIDLANKECMVQSVSIERKPEPPAPAAKE